MKIALPTIMHTGNHLAQQHIFKNFEQGTLEGIKEEDSILITYHVIDAVPEWILDYYETTYG